MVRCFSKDRLTAVLSTGTDRDYRSNVDHHPEVDREKEWMDGLGIRDKSQVTFASSLGPYLAGGANAPQTHAFCYVIYDKKYLFKIGYASNGFHAFLCPPSDALVGVISDEGTISLSSVAKQPTRKHDL